MKHHSFTKTPSVSRRSCKFLIALAALFSLCADLSVQAGAALLVATGDQSDLARPLCARSRLENAAGDVDASGRMLAEAEVLAQDLQLGPDSQLGRGLAEARALLATKRSKSP